jgi:hypothetical protein
MERVGRYGIMANLGKDSVEEHCWAGALEHVSDLTPGIPGQILTLTNAWLEIPGINVDHAVIFKHLGLMNG